MSPFRAWREHFEKNRTRPLPPIHAPPLRGDQHEALTDSLKIFQLGETGEGRIAQQIRSVRLRHVDDDYCEALGMFVAEEGRHARILGLMVRALGGTLLERNWTAKLFVHARRLFGVRFKLLVLLAAEVIGIGFYGLLGASLPEGAMASALRQICGDEEDHLRFHCDFFRLEGGWIFRALWWPLGFSAALAVLIDHRRTLRAFDVPMSFAARRLIARVVEAARLMRQGAPDLTQFTTAQKSGSLR
jgi:hypothetical protein